jgi:predicted anti-sigma-YlaC factor YlaD
MTYAPCAEWEERLSAYHDRQDTPRDRAAVDAHLRDCPACRTALAKLEADRDRYLSACADLSIDVRAAVLEEITVMPESSRTVPVTWFRVLLAFSGVTTLALVALLVLAFVPNGRQTTASSVVRQLQVATDMRTAPPPIDALDLPSGDRLQRSPAAPIPPTITFYNDQGKLWAPSTGMHSYRSVDDTGKKPNMGYDADEKNQRTSYGYSGLLDRSERNYGIVGGVRMSYDVNYNLQVRQALVQARQAGTIIKSHGGFVIDFGYQGDTGQIPTAVIHGKVPSDQADAALRALEKLGHVTALNVAGEDLTLQFQQYMDEMAKQRAHADRLGQIAHRARPRPALTAEEQRHWAEQQAAEAHRNLLGVQAKSQLIELTAVFSEGKAKERYGAVQFQDSLRSIISILLMLLIILAVAAGIVGLIVGPIVLARWLRRRESA